MTQTQIAEKAHATLGASSASRWMACPGSVRLAEQAPPDQGNIHSFTGDAAHALAELALTKGADPSLWLGLPLGKKGTEVVVDEDMVDFVRTYVEHCRGYMVPGMQWWIEHRFDLGALNPPGPMFGTADFVAYDPTHRTLYVKDLKYGQGVVVEAVGNKQLRYYALGALISPAMKGLAIDTVEMSIIQPRAQHPEGVIRSDRMSFDDLLGFTYELLEAARATTAPDAPLVAGSHCRWCRARGLCPAQRERAEAIAQVEFVAVPVPSMPKAPELMTTEELVRVLDVAAIMEDWIDAVRGAVHRKLSSGEDVPGYKLVWKRAQRKWRDEAQALAALQALGAKSEDLIVTKLKSVAQIEKVVGKKFLPAEQVVQESSGLTLAPADDPRQAVTAGEEFAALPSGSSE